jgi:hypothetical protein
VSSKPITPQAPMTSSSVSMAKQKLGAASSTLLSKEASIASAEVGGGRFTAGQELELEVVVESPEDALIGPLDGSQPDLVASEHPQNLTREQVAVSMRTGPGIFIWGPDLLAGMVRM